MTWGSFAIGGYSGSALCSIQKSPALDPNIVEELKLWPPCTSLDDLPSTFEVEETIKSMSNRKSVGPDELPAELLKLALDEDRDGTPHTGTVPCHCDRNMAGRGRTAEVERCHDYCFAQGEGPDGVR